MWPPWRQCGVVASYIQGRRNRSAGGESGSHNGGTNVWSGSRDHPRCGVTNQPALLGDLDETRVRDTVLLRKYKGFRKPVVAAVDTIAIAPIGYVWLGNWTCGIRGRGALPRLPTPRYRH